ncbi:MAG: DUF1992 domain-containing protein [Anaerolineales bacterium]|nr:DUF1992 domain-containing protein [Anaerolineales bacterium]MCB8953804.1 DUF1992 domain-containing protein [Ardenticatenales bacterium]
MGNIDWEGFIEKKIREAMEKGEFSNLRGEGRPFSEMEENPFEDPDQRLAFHMLKSNGFTLPWITRRQEILTQVERAGIPLRRSWEIYQHRIQFRPNDAQAEANWQRAYAQFTQRLAEINKQIDDYNLMVPSDVFRMLPLYPERELARLTAPHS